MTLLYIVAASGFIYVAVADLTPQLRQRMSLADTAAQPAWRAAGMAIIVVVVRAVQ